MPSVSSKQRRAMEAAAHGKSTLGIPKKVGRQFVAADKGVIAKRKANNHGKGHGLKNQVADADPMAKRSTNYP